MTRRRAGTFRRRNALAAWDHGPNMTPMVDVVMVILVFFMASSSVLGPEWFLRSALPRVRATAPPPSQDEPTRLRITLDLAPGGDATRATIVASPADDAAPKGADLAAIDAYLRARAAAIGPDKLIVILAPSGDVPYPDIVRLHETCYALGIAKVGVAELKREGGVE